VGRYLASERDVHMIVVSEGLVAVGALARPRRETLFDTFLAENVTTRLDGGVFEVPTADRAKCKGL